MKMFLYIDPLKQGLKRMTLQQALQQKQFLYIDPLKQGLKPHKFTNDNIYYYQFLYIDPLKQGLKLNISAVC